MSIRCMEAAASGVVLSKKLFLKILLNSQSLFFDKIADLSLHLTSKKETLGQVFFCEFCNILGKPHRASPGSRFQMFKNFINYTLCKSTHLAICIFVFLVFVNQILEDLFLNLSVSQKGAAKFTKFYNLRTRCDFRDHFNLKFCLNSY